MANKKYYVKIIYLGKIIRTVLRFLKFVDYPLQLKIYKISHIISKNHSFRKKTSDFYFLPKK